MPKILTEKEGKEKEREIGAERDLKENSEKKCFISIDNTIEEMIEYINNGFNVFFEDSADRILRIPPEVVEQLPYIVKIRYTMARSIADGTLQFDNPDGFRELRAKANPRFASATNRLMKKNGLPGFTYSYKRTDEIGACEADGFQIVDGNDPVQTFGDNGGIREVKQGGVTEMILMKIPTELANAKLKEVEFKSKKIKGSIQDTAQREILKEGGKPFVPER